MEKDELFKKVRTEGRVSDNLLNQYEQQLRTYQIESLDELRASMDEQSKATKTQGEVEQHLSIRILWLNVILGILTLTGAVAGVIGLIAIIGSSQ